MKINENEKKNMMEIRIKNTVKKKNNEGKKRERI